MSLSAISLCLIAGVIAASAGPDFLGIAALVTAVSGVVFGAVGLHRSRGRTAPQVLDPAESVTELIRMAQNLERCQNDLERTQTERDKALGRVDELVAELLRMHDRKGQHGR